VAPVFSPAEVEFYLPAGTWTSLLTGDTVEGGSWRRETHGYDSLPLYVREGAVLPLGARDDRPDYDYRDGLTLVVYPGPDGERSVNVTTPEGESAEYTVTRSGGSVRATGPAEPAFTLRDAATGRESAASGGVAAL
jgi:alpha-D-xyloside xylohydrolase